MQSQDIEEGALEVKLKTEEVIDILVKAYTNSDLARDIAKHVDELCQMVDILYNSIMLKGH